MPNQHTKNPIPIADRFWAKVNKNGPIPEYAPHLGPCWLWTAGTAPSGYGHFGVDNRTVYAHRWAYGQVRGPIPAGLECDHLCRVRHCVRLTHIVVVTARVNILRGFSAPAINARKTLCIHGHPFDEANTYRRPDGTRRGCKACQRRRQQLARM